MAAAFTPTVATGMPGGIWMMLSMASRPSSMPLMGTPMTGNVVEGVDTGLLIRDGYEKTNVFDGIDVEFRDNRMAVLKNGTFVWKNRFNTSAKSMVVPSEGNEIVKTG